MKKISYLLSKKEFIERKIFADLCDKTAICSGDEIIINCIDGDLGTAKCLAVQEIEIHNRGLAILDGKPYGFGGVDSIVRVCGFRNSDEFKPNLPFKGFFVKFRRHQESEAQS